MTHGSKSHRALGSIGAGTTPGRVYKGKKMPGRMGGTKTKIRKLKIVKIDSELRVVMIKGAVPGKPGNLLRVTPAKILNYLRIAVSSPKTSFSVGRTDEQSSITVLDSLLPLAKLGSVAEQNRILGGHTCISKLGCLEEIIAGQTSRCHGSTVPSHPTHLPAARVDPCSFLSHGNSILKPL
ncbi:hypothetical protein BHM03_00008401 [Ensete ventricosum]|nr:hypothetical protein BHM03_00008401 [Ensete ventricosum]